MNQQEKVLRVYADGVFDGFHIGHSNMLKQCREAFPNQKIHLIAGVCDQDDIEEHKGMFASMQDQLFILKKNVWLWWLRTNMLTRSLKKLLGFCPKVSLYLLRIHFGPKYRLCLSR